MFCSRLRGRLNLSRFGAFSALSSSSSSSTRFTRRSFSQQWDHQQNPWAKFPVRVLAPTAWTIAAVTTIYFTCAAWEVYEDVRVCRATDSRRPLTFERLEQSRTWRGSRDASKGRISPSFPMSYGGEISPKAVWQSLSEPGKVVAGIAALNFTSMALALSPSNSARQFIGKLAHVPVDGMFKNRQLLTSAFVHSGPFHLLANMFVLSNFGSSLANHSPIFRGSGSHTAAFLLSGATISALGSHISTKFWPNKMHRFRPGVGFSGAVSATFAAFCMQRPDARIHIFPLPWEFSARDMLQFSAAFEALGVLGAWRFLRLDVAFACHLTGLAFGAAYVTYGKRGKYWTSSRHAAFRAMQVAKVI